MIPDHYTIQFGKNFKLATQQTQQRFEKCAVVETGCTGEAKTHNLITAIDDNEVTGERFGKTVLQELDSEKRWIRPRMFDLATGEPKWDEELLGTTVLPGGTQLSSHQAAYARRCDRVFLDGLLGVNYKGKNGTTETNIPAANTVAVDWNAPGVTDANSGLIVDKIIEAVGILQDNESYGDEAEARGITLWGAMTPAMQRALLYLANASNGSAANRLFSKDFMPPVLDNEGRIKFFMGVNWIRSSYLPLDAADPTIRYAAVWTSDAVHMDFWGTLNTDVCIRKDLKNAVQYFSQYSMNACRSEDKKVVKIACKV